MTSDHNDDFRLWAEVGWAEEAMAKFAHVVRNVYVADAAAARAAHLNAIRSMEVFESATDDEINLVRLASIDLVKATASCVRAVASRERRGR